AGAATPSRGGRSRILQAEVSDSGIGIEADRLPRIFNAFEESDRHRQRLSGGLGLGLAISRSVLQAHGSQLAVASPGRDRGTTFSIELAALPLTYLGDPACDVGLNADERGGPR